MINAIKLNKDDQLLNAFVRILTLQIRSQFA